MDDLQTLKQLLPTCMLQDQIRLGLQLKRILDKRVRPSQNFICRLIDKAEKSAELRQYRQNNLPKITYPNLPVSERRQEIVNAIRNNQVLIIAGETGSGKTTQIPKMCLEAGLGIRATIGCTQPRRVAAMSLSKRLAEELNVTWGRDVGCKIRFSDYSHSQTFIKLMTDGIMLAELQSDPFLCQYDAIMVDEAHERTLNIDFLLGTLKELTRKRDDLKLLITSATIDTQTFSEAFDNAPIIEVSGRTYPVEVIYREEPQTDPLLPQTQSSRHSREEEEEESVLEMAVSTVDEILQTTTGGDILIFMPSEHDIRQTIAMLEGRKYNRVEILPLYGLQSSAEQQRVFSISQKRRIVVATNIAETSLTIPNVHFVVDTGLARISRYNARTRTKRLPIEYVSQSSANQRKGRCGRVANGICYRLYTEKDFDTFAPYTQPEIQRANLAEVILRMTAFHLGKIETFPFINPPTSQAIHSGYTLLQELGALDNERKLTRIGMQLARMAMDPSLGRMVLQARDEGVLEEILIIASGLSIQDPRERPTEQRALAETAHKEFADPQSDFITLYNLWNAYKKAWRDLKTENQVRKYCKAHFISFVRMREWGDLYAQLKDILDEMGIEPTITINRKVKPTVRKLNRKAPDTENISGLSPEARDGIHRSVLSGLLGHIAQRQENNIYKAVGNREVLLFPGSVLFGKSNNQHSRKQTDNANTPKIQQPEWVVAGEIVETSRLFVRTVAGIDIAWVEEIAPHICKKTYHDAHWDQQKERVIVKERVTAHGLTVQERWCDYGKIKPQDATDIFIRDGLVEFETSLITRPKFLDHNQNLCQKLEVWQAHGGRNSTVDILDAMCQFYNARIQNVSSIHDLNRLLKEHHREKNFLFATEEDLLGKSTQQYDRADFPDAIQLAGHKVAVQYRRGVNSSREQQDEIAIRVPLPLLPVLDRETVDWSIPGFRTARWEELLDSLPRPIRRSLMPLRVRAERLSEAIDTNLPNIIDRARQFVLREWGIEIPSHCWQTDFLLENSPRLTTLTPQIEVLSNDGKKVFSGLNIETLQTKIKEHAEKEDQKEWQIASEKWEKYGITDWSFDKLPESIEIRKVRGIPVLAFPGLQVEDGEVNLRLFRTPTERDQHLIPGIRALAEKMLGKEFAWIRRDLRKLTQAKMDFSTLGTAEEFEETAYTCLKNYALNIENSEPPSLSKRYFDHITWEAKQKLRDDLPLFLTTISDILNLRTQILVHPKIGAPGFEWMKKDLNMLVTTKFLSYTPFGRLRHIPRYLKMILIRAARAATNPTKDWEKAQRVAPWQKELDSLLLKKNLPPDGRKGLWNLFWMMQEYKVSCYAQELGTAEPVSPKKLEATIREVKNFL